LRLHSPQPTAGRTTPIGPRRPIRPAIALLAISLSLGGCARGVSVQPPPTPVYAVAITNTTAVEIVVSYDDGTAPRALGTVLPGRTERFVIAAPASTSVDILTRSATGGTTFGPFRVVLIAGSTVPLSVGAF
jgi:hypothetical protein